MPAPPGRRAGAGLAAALVVLAACGTRLPPLPDVRADGFAPAVRAAVEQAVAEARGRPGDAAASGRAGMALHAHGQPAAARAWYSRAAALAPGEFRWRYYLGLVQRDSGDPAAAIETLRAALRISPAEPIARLRLADLLLEAGRVSESAREYEAVRAARPDWPAATYGLARARAQQGDDSRAAELYSRAAGLFPSYGAAHFALAAFHRRRGDQAAADAEMRLYEAGRLTLPPDPDPWMAEVRSLAVNATAELRRGAELEAAGRLEEAIDAQERALKADPSLAQAHVNLISLYGRRERYEEAAAHYRAAIALEPGRADAHYNYGVMLVNAMQFPEAAAAFREAVRIEPHNPDAQNNLGFAVEQSGDLDAALRCYRAAVATRPGFRLARFHIGRILAARGQYSAAIAQFEQILDPEDESTPRALYALGATWARAGRPETAARWLRRARERAEAWRQNDVVASIERDLLVLSAPSK